MTRSEDQVAELVSACRDLAASRCIETRAAAHQVLVGVEYELVLRLAAQCLTILSTRADRESTLRAERHAQRPVRTDLSPAITREPDYQRELETIADEMREVLHQDLLGLIGEHDGLLAMTWDARLLASPFKFGDGSMVLWGEATPDQHRQCRDEYLDRSSLNLEGAARHQCALRDLEVTGCANLNDLSQRRRRSA